MRLHRLFGLALLASALLALLLLLIPGLRALTLATTAQAALQAARSHPGDRALAQEARLAIARAQTVAPDDPGLYRARAEASTLAGEPALAVAALERAAALFNDSPLITQELALAYEAAGMAERARPLWAELGQSGLSLTQVGERYRGAGQLDEALVWYQRAAALDPALADPWYYRGLVAKARKEWAAAQASFDAALARPFFAAVGASDLLTQKALTFYLADPTETRDLLALYAQARAQADFRSNLLAATAPYEMGQISEARGAAPAEAAEHYRAALAVRPTHQWARMRLGRLLFARLGDPAGAEAQLRWVIAQIPQNPDHKWAYRWLGDLYRAQNRRPDALAAYQAAARIDPSDATIQQDLRAVEALTK